MDFHDHAVDYVLKNYIVLFFDRYVGAIKSNKKTVNGVSKLPIVLKPAIGGDDCPSFEVEESLDGRLTLLPVGPKVPFIYYVITFIAQNLIFDLIFLKAIFVVKTKKDFFFNITFWGNFHVEV